MRMHNQLIVRIRDCSHILSPKLEGFRTLPPSNPPPSSIQHLVLKEGETVLAVPVVGLVLHPVEPGHNDDDDDDDDCVDENEHKPGDLSPVVIPGPVAVLVISVGAVHCRSDPPLVPVSGWW